HAKSDFPRNSDAIQPPRDVKLPPEARMTSSQWGTVGRHAPSCQCWATAPRGQLSVVPWRAKEGHSLKHRVVATVLGRRPRVAGRPVAAVPGNAPTLGR